MKKKTTFIYREAPRRWRIKFYDPWVRMWRETSTVYSTRERARKAIRQWRKEDKLLDAET